MHADRRVLETVLYAADLDAAERFYGEVLGLPLDSRKPGLFRFFRVGPAMLLLFDPEAAGAQPRRPAARRHAARAMPASPCPRPSSTPGSSASRAHGVAIEHEQTWPRGGRSFYVRDPAGNSIELATPRIWGLPEAGGRAPHDRGLARARPDHARGPGGRRAGAAWSRPGARGPLRRRPRLPLVLHRLHAAAAGAGRRGRPRWSGTRSCSTRICRRAASPATQYLERRFGSVAQAHGVHRRVAQAGAREGIPFAFGAIRAQPNTVAAHALVLAAAAHGPRARGGGGAVPRLLRRGRQHRRRRGAGADRRRSSASTPRRSPRPPAPAAARPVVAAHERAFALGIAGVPVCVFGDDHVIAGAQPPEVLEALLDLERYRLRAGRPRRRSRPPRLVVARSRRALAAAALVAGRHVGLRASR